jgi:hypothetical protein|tara:strand:- start:272 stop:574 length:303 start_codon:yes stop_codon:yes gene_type:complete
MANDFQMVNGDRIQLTDEEQAAVNAERNHYKTVIKPANQFSDLRRQRNQLLSETDYLFGSDVPLMSDEKTQEWRTYRQALRDLPANTADPTNITWPEEPE